VNAWVCVLRPLVTERSGCDVLRRAVTCCGVLRVLDGLTDQLTPSIRP
jgi:hypothetical protein